MSKNVFNLKDFLKWGPVEKLQRASILPAVDNFSDWTDELMS